MLTSRLRRTGSGYSASSASAFLDIVAVADAGGLSYQNWPNAVYYNGVTYFGYINGGNGNVEVRTYTHATRVTSAATVIHAALEVDTHNPPALLIRDSDKHLMVFYSKHSDTNEMYKRVASVAESISGGFSPSINVHSSVGGTDYTYPSVMQLTGEANSPIYWFFREDNTIGTPGTRATLSYTKSIDGGSTWSAKVRVFAPAARPYWVVRSDGQTRIDVFTSSTDRAFNDNVPGFHCYYEGGTWHKSDGSSAGSLPLDTSDMTEVYDGTAGSVDPHEIAYRGSEPILAFHMYEPPAPSGGRSVWWASFDGAAWDAEQVDPAAGAIALDAFMPDVAYVARIVSARFEVWRYARDGAGVWTRAQLWSSPTDDMEAIISVKDRHPTLRALWTAGSIVSFSDFDLGIFGTAR